MSPKNALIATVLLILWLLLIDRRRRESVSLALWLPTIWALILGSRPASSWFNLGVAMESADDYLEGSPFDRQLFLFLIFSGAAVLVKRRFDWRALLSGNKAVAFYFIYFALSAIWSDYPFTAFKRWIKDFGNVIMVLVVLTEANPIEALRSVLARCLYILVPMSVLLIRYFPELGRSYDRFSYEPYIQGVTLFKNQLGMMVAICFIVLVWDLLHAWRIPGKNRDRLDILNHFALGLMGIWLLHVAKSATSIVCTLLGSATMTFLRFPAVQRRLDKITVYACIGIPSVLLLNWMFDLTGMVFKLLGRDPSLTGRTDIWGLVLAEQDNPIFGAGFYTFWTGERITRFWKMYGVGMNQAHNGYLEVYLIGGIVGVGALLAMLMSTGARIRKRLALDGEWAGVRLTFWLFAIVHNFTEASYSKISLLWFVLLAIMIEYPTRLTLTSAADNSAATLPHIAHSDNEISSFQCRPA